MTLQFFLNPCFPWWPGYYSPSIFDILPSTLYIYTIYAFSSSSSLSTCVNNLFPSMWRIWIFPFKLQELRVDDFWAVIHILLSIMNVPRRNYKNKIEWAGEKESLGIWRAQRCSLYQKLPWENEVRLLTTVQIRNAIYRRVEAMGSH